jgi:hypothetical protein
MATGDILAVRVLADGYHAEVDIENLDVGGTYAFGLGANNDPTTGVPRVVFTVVSLGFDDTGSATTITRYVYGVNSQRKPYPNNTSLEEAVVSTTLTVQILLSDYIYQKDNTGAGNSGTAVTCNILSGFYTKTAVPNNAASNVTVTNNSTVAYTKVVANWSWPGYQLYQGSTGTNRCVAFHAHGRNGRPVRVVKFTTTDGTVTDTQYIKTMSIDKTIGDAVCVPEYICTFDNTQFTQSATLTCNFVAYPWIGDSASVLDTSTGTADPTPAFGPKTGICDKNSTYGVTVAYVDSASGNNGTGVAADIANTATASASPFLNIGAAAVAITNYNTANRSRSNCGAGIIYLKAGSHAFTGSAITGVGAAPAVWVTIMPAPGVSRASAIIASNSTATDISDRIKVQGVTITTASVNTFSGCLALWFDQCEFNTTNIGLSNSTGGTVWATRNLVTQLGQGFRPNSTTNNPWGLVRGNTMPGFSGTILCYTTLGNLRNGTPTGSTVLTTDYSGMLSPAPANNIIAYNKIMNGQNSTVMMSCNTFFANTFGTAFIQNVLEHAQRHAAGNALADFSSSDNVSTNTPCDNLIMWNNTMIGERCFVGYNDSATPSVVKHRRYWSRKNNAWGRSANKGDVFGTADGVRVGGWPCTFGPNCSGEYHSQNTQSLPGNFYMEFPGIKTWQPNTSTYGTVAQMGFKGAACIVENPLGTFTSGAGNGDYTPAVSSPMNSQTLELLIPWDIDGNPRSTYDAAGAYALPKATFRSNMMTC